MGKAQRLSCSSERVPTYPERTVRKGYRSERKGRRNFDRALQHCERNHDRKASDRKGDGPRYPLARKALAPVASTKNRSGHIRVAEKRENAIPPKERKGAWKL
jgi:hypothetical protein